MGSFIWKLVTVLGSAEGPTMTEGGNKWWYFWSHWKEYSSCTMIAGCLAAGVTTSECYSTLIRSECHLGEFTVPVWQEDDEWLLRDDGRKWINQSQASIQWKVNGAWWYANQVWGSLRWVRNSNVSAIWWVVVGIMVRNESTNMRPAFSGKSLEHDGMLIRSAHHFS